jgi:hypothetical protein
MPAIPNVIRRGAIYYWRRRLPKSAATSLGCKQVLLSISLCTADSGIARRKGARMTAFSLDVFEYGRQNMVTQEQLTNIMRHEAQRLYQDLTEQAAFDRANGGLESIDKFGLNPKAFAQVMAETNRRRAGVMKDLRPDAPEVSALKAIGWTDRMVEVLVNNIELNSYFSSIAHSPEYLAEIAAKYGILEPIAPEHLSMMDSALLRGSAAAFDKHAKSLSIDGNDDFKTAIEVPPVSIIPSHPLQISGVRRLLKQFLLCYYLIKQGRLNGALKQGRKAKPLL